MPMNEAAADAHVWSGIRIHIMDIVHPPIGMSPIAAIDAPQTTVPAALATNSAAHVQKKRALGGAPVDSPRQQSRPTRIAASIAPITGSPGLTVLVVTTPPDPLLVAAEGRAIQPLVHAPQPVQPPRVRRVRVIDGAPVAHERAHTGPLADERGHVGADTGRGLGDRSLAAVQQPGPLAGIVVLAAAVALLRLADAHAKVVVEVGARGGRPGESPAHPLQVGLQLRQLFL